MALTPMMKQYFEVKESCKDCILFFRLGDFYEMFFDDAKLASKELELALTGRDCGLEQRAPMCGVPYHAAQNYIRALINKGYKVAIGEQVEDPSVAKGIVKREVVKIITPGTYTDSQFLEEDKNNFVMSLYINKENNNLAMSFGDISTGELYCTEDRFAEGYILNEIAKFNPSEILIQNNIDDKLLEGIKERFSFSCTFVDEEHFYSGYEENLEEQFDNYGDFSFSNELKYCINGLIKYLKNNLKLSPAHMNNIEYYNLLDYLSIDANSKKNLELTETLRDKSKRGSLLWVLDKTQTAMGGRRLRKWIEQPLIQKNKINHRLNAVEELLNSVPLHEDIKEILDEVYDIERLIGKISTKNISPKEMYALKISIEKLPKMKEILKRANSPLLKSLYEELDTLEDIYELLEKSISETPPITLKEGGIIKEGYIEEIDELREAKLNGKRWIAALEAKEKEEIGIKSLKIKHNKVFGYYIEITKSNLHLVPEGRYIRKQTLANAERYVTPELKEMEEKIQGAEERLVDIEYEAFVKIREQIELQLNRIKESAKIVSEIDCLTAFAQVAREQNYSKPEINTEGVLNIKDGRHPVVEKILPHNSFVENDVYMDNVEDIMLLITGPNMAGKSTYMRQVALITLMAQIGSFVPASQANISICDKIFTRIGASDDLASGKSTFMVEMWEVSNILKNATNRSLVLLDEVGRGTSTYDGLSIAWAVIEYMCCSNHIKCKTLFATHYHELIQLEGKIPGLKNYSVAIKEINNELVFIRKVVRGGTDDSYGIEVAKLAGIPDGVINRAKEILNDLEQCNKVEIDDESKLKVKSSPDISIKACSENLNEVKEEACEKKKEEVISYAAVDSDDASMKQMNFSDISKDNLVNDIKNLDILSMNPMDGFNKLYELIQRAKEI